MPDINITVTRKVVACDAPAIVCDNSDYTVHWTLDEEWSAYDTKTMRTIYMDGTYTDTVFSGAEVELPVVTVPGVVQIGLFAGDIRTSRVASLRVLSSVRSASGAPANPTPDVYDQIMERMGQIENPNWNQNATTAKDYVKNRTHWVDDDGTVHKLDEKFLPQTSRLPPATTSDNGKVLKVVDGQWAADFIANDSGVTEAVEDIEIVVTQGKFAKWASGNPTGGGESSITWAARSQFIPVTPGETLRISCRSANTCPGVVFYKTNTMSIANGVGYALENPGTGDPSSGSVNRYTYINKDVVVPANAAYAILNNADGTESHVWKCQKVTFVTNGNTSDEELKKKLANAEYDIDQLARRLTYAEKHNDFAWGTFDKAYFVFIHDDSRAFITTAYSAFHSKGVPVSSAAIAPYLNDTYNGKAVKEWLNLIVADGGEVLCHYSYDLKDSDDDALWREHVVDAKREFEQNGFTVRGMILAGSSDVNSAKGEKFCRQYFDYADKVGTSAQYNLGRKLMLIFDSLNAFKQRIDACAQTPGLYAFGFHGNRADETWITEASLKEIIDYILAKDNCEITTYGAVFDKIGTTALEKRIDALEKK